MTHPDAQDPARAVELVLEPPLAVVRMNDPVGRNRSSAALRLGVIDALRRAGDDQRIRVVLLEGTPEVFCAGATADELLGDHRQRIDDNWEFVRAPAVCPLPVVSAVQGHAIGGGLFLALYADVNVLSDSSHYMVSMLTYGFTPMLGATHLVPAKMGLALGTEMIYTGRPYRGRELAGRGAGVLIVPHNDVLRRARATAESIAQAPRRTLELMKVQFAEVLTSAAVAAHEREVPDHVSTISSPEAHQRIANLHAGLVSPTTDSDQRTHAWPAPGGSG